MELDKNIFKKYAKIDIKNLEAFDSINLIDDVVKSMQEDTEDMYYKFLTENGYKIDKPYNMKQIEEIKKDLEKQDKFVDTIEWIENKSDKDNYTITRHIIPFFNRISNPLSEEDKQELLEKWKKENRKDEIV